MDDLLLKRFDRLDDKVGTIESAWGTFIYADAHAAEYERTPVHLYSVMFTSRDLWGNEGGDWIGFLAPR